MNKIDPATIKRSPRLFAAVSPPGRDGKRWIDYLSARRTAREARAEAGRGWPGGWADLEQRGWRIAPVFVEPSHD
jgi:hypothetical protein